MAAGVPVVDELDVSAPLTNEEIMLPLTQHGLAANYDSAAALTKRRSPQVTSRHRSGRRHDPMLADGFVRVASLMRAPRPPRATQCR